MQVLGEEVLANRRDFRSMVSKDHTGTPVFGAVVWMDRDSDYIVSTSEDCTQGSTIERSRYRSIDGKAEKIDLCMPIPKVAEKYFEVCSRVEEHSRCRQDVLNMEKKIETKNWAKRVNHSLLSACVVDSWLLYKNGAENASSQQDFYCKLAEELIHHNYGEMVTRQRREDKQVTHIVTGDTTVTNRKRNSNGNACLQKRCVMCKKKTKYICRICLSDVGKELFVCGEGSGRNCAEQHKVETHEDESSS